jgi:hypothetical protein
MANKIRKPFDWDKNSTTNCIEDIALYLGLPIKINLSYVSKDYKKQNENKFESYHLSKTDWMGRGTEGITAQVLRPANLPLYGTSELNNFPISIRISENCKDNPKTFIAVIAHELSHIVLHSLWHKEKDNEFYTDLTAMILGFSKIIKDGRKIVKIKSGYNYTETQTTTYGYLSDEQFDFAFNKIKAILETRRDSKKKFSQKLTAYKKLISLYQKSLFKFKEFLRYLDKHRNQKIDKEDEYRIMLFHQMSYIDDLTEILNVNTKKFLQLDSFLQGFFHYNQRSLNLLGNYEAEINTLIINLQNKLNLLNQDVNILKKYINVFFRFWIIYGQVP